MPKVKHPVSGMVINVKAERAEKLVERGYELVEGELPEQPAVEHESPEIEEESTAPGPEAQGNAPVRPASWSRKATWAEYAEAMGIDVADKSKQQIIEAVEAREAD